MRQFFKVCLHVLVLSSPQRLILFCAAAFSCCGDLAAEPVFARQRLDTFFYAESSAVADFDGDGHSDVVGGPHVFLGPAFDRKRTYRPPHAYDRLSYSNAFITFTDDFNADGAPDIMVIGWPGTEAIWYENPGAGAGGLWPHHMAYSSVDTESPMMADVNGDGRRDIVAATGGRAGWMEADPRDSRAPWTFHPITPPGAWQRYTHGVGLGDVNGDGRPDFLEANGWWEQPADLAGDPAWTFHAQSFGSGGAQMFAYDVNGDGRADVITSIAAHGYGVSWFEQAGEAAGATTWIEHPITSRDPAEKLNGVQFSQPHALALADMDGDGLQDVITGKRHWAHGDKKDPEPNAPAVLYWFRLSRGADGAEYTPHLIDDDSGVGTDFAIADLDQDERPDIAMANKKGVFVFKQTED